MLSAVRKLLASILTREMTPQSRRGGGEGGAPGSGQQGAAEGEGAASGVGGVVEEEVRLRRVVLREVWRQAVGFGGP
jgi:hypothetical protein